MYGIVDNELTMEHNDWIWVVNNSAVMYNYLGKDIDDPLLAFNNWEKLYESLCV